MILLFDPLKLVFPKKIVTCLQVRHISFSECYFEVSFIIKILFILFAPFNAHADIVLLVIYLPTCLPANATFLVGFESLCVYSRIDENDLAY